MKITPRRAHQMTKDQLTGLLIEQPRKVIPFDSGKAKLKRIQTMEPKPL